MKTLIKHAISAARAQEAKQGVKAEPALGILADEVERLDGILNTPEFYDFIKAVPLEAAQQVARWGTEQDSGKEPQDWFWLVGYLAGKALRAHLDGDTEKALHHCISTSAALANWHAQILGASNMRPGIEPPTA